MEDHVTDVSQLIDESRISRFQILVAVLCALAVFMDGFDTQMVGYVLPAIAKSMQIAPSALRPVMVSGLVGLMAGALGFGLVADRVRHKGVIILCLVIFGPVMLVTGDGDVGVPALVAGASSPDSGSAAPCPTPSRSPPSTRRSAAAPPSS